MATESANAPSRHKERMITFEITTPSPLPVGQQVFISGNIEALGAWRPDGFPLTRLDDNLWTGYTVIEQNADVEFKVTRGTWSTEEVEAGGGVRAANHILPRRGDIAFRHAVPRWLDRD